MMMLMGHRALWWMSQLVEVWRLRAGAPAPGGRCPAAMLVLALSGGQHLNPHRQ